MTVLDRSLDLVRPARRAVAVAFLYNGLIAGSWAPHIPLVKARLELSDAMLGGALLAMGAGAMFAMVFASVLIERFGSARVVQVSGLLLAVWLPLPALAPDLTTLVVALLGFGAAMGTMDVSMNAQAVAVERAYPRPVMSSFHGMWSVGGLVGAGSGGIVLQSVGIGFHLGLVVVVVVGAAAWCLPRLMMAVDGESAGKAGLSIPGGATIVLGLLTFLSMVSEGAMLDWSAVYLSEERGAGTAAAASAFAAFSGAMAAGRFLGDGIRARFSAVGLAAASGVIAATGFTIGIFSPSSVIAVCGFALAGLGISNLVPLFFSAAGKIPGGRSAHNLAAVATTGYTGFLIGPVLIGGLSELIGLAAALLLLPLACLLVVVLSGAVRHAD